VAAQLATSYPWGRQLSLFFLKNNCLVFNIYKCATCQHLIGADVVPSIICQFLMEFNSREQFLIRPTTETSKFTLIPHRAICKLGQPQWLIMYFFLIFFRFKKWKSTHNPIKLLYHCQCPLQTTNYVNVPYKLPIMSMCPQNYEKKKCQCPPY
jgi:hypothetical protein